MMIQRLIAVIMILGSSVLVAWASGDIAFPAILGMLGLLGVLRRFTWDIRPERHFITPLLLLLLAILFALHCRYAHVRSDQAAAFAWQTIARYFLASMILLLFLRPHRTRDFGLQISDFGLKEAIDTNPQSSVGLPHSLGLFHLASALAAGQVLLLDDRYVAFRLTELLSVTLVILYAALDSTRVVSSRTSVVGAVPPGNSRLPTTGYRLPLCLALLLLAAINLGWIGGSMLYRHMETINFLPAWLSRGSAALETTTAEVAHVAFSTSGRLSSVLSIKEDADSAPVLTVLGDSNPRYLRAMAFETYHQSSWHDLSYREAISPEQNTPFGTLLVGRTNLFRLHEEEAPWEITIRHESSIADAMFTPLGTCSVEAPLNLLMRDDDDIVSSPTARNRLSYRVAYAAASGKAPSGAQSRRMLAIPSQLDPGVRARANRIFRGCTTTAQKIEAVTRYFHTDYTYVLGLEVPAERDALNYFLLEASSGYCEYFASGAAILLRFVNVPTRYVTGFLVTEQGDDRRTWVARNMDAHAWVEAWDAEQGQWTIVEATAQEGLGDASLADELARGAGGGRPLLTRLVEALYEYGLFGVIGVAWRGPLALTLTGLAFLLLTVAIVAKVLRPGRMTRRGRSCSRTQGQDGLATLHRLLVAMDRQTKALGYRRQPDETLHAFAARLEAAPQAVSSRKSELSSMSLRAQRSNLPSLGLRLLRRCAPRNDMLPTSHGLADWYLRYAGLRYARVLDPARIEQLQRLAQEPHDRR